MRYFTPERFVRLQNLDAGSVTAALEDWDRAVRDYSEAIARAEPCLPAPLRQFVVGSLHDAVLLGSWRQSDRLHLLLRPGLPGEPLVLLAYRLVEPPWVNTSALPPNYRTPRTDWLYDEIGIESDGTFSHSILFSDGREARLRFTEFEYSRPEAAEELLPANG
jgi:hypothetical protein